MSTRTIGIVMNGITGRMGYRQHLVRSILAIRDQGGVELSDGSRLQVDPILVGRNAERVKEIADRHNVPRWTTDLTEALSGDDEIYFDAQLTTVREESILQAIAAGKAVYTEKPISESLEGSLRLARAAPEAGLKDGVVERVVGVIVVVVRSDGSDHAQQQQGGNDEAGVRRGGLFFNNNRLDFHDGGDIATGQSRSCGQAEDGSESSKFGHDHAPFHLTDAVTGNIEATVA